MIDAIPRLNNPKINSDIVLCTIVQVDIGAKAFGVNASKGVLRMTIRALYEEEMGRLQQNLEDIAQTEAEKYGLKVSFDYQDQFPVTSNHKESSDKIRQVCKKKACQWLRWRKRFVVPKTSVTTRN